MREHMGLYRGKRIDNGEWVEGAYHFTGRYHVIITGRIEEQHIVYGHYSVCVPMYVIDPDTVGECTGLRDKNGKLIFEGDICQIKNHRLITDLPFVIEWEDFAYNGWTWRDLDENGAVDSFTKGAAKFSEIIGNVHDNPELLEVGEDDG